MDRISQLSNVAFGGDWSEEIAPREARQAALRHLRKAVALSEEEDPATGDTRAALGLLTSTLPKGALLSEAFERALVIPHPGLRRAELVRVLGNLESALGAEV